MLAPFFEKLQPVDVIALVVIVGGLYLKLSGADGVVGSLLTAIVFYYFGKKRFYDNTKTGTTN